MAKRNPVLVTATSAATTLVASAAAAHPGHGDGATGLLHYLSEPVHVLFALGLAVSVGLLARALAPRRGTRPAGRPRTG
jgi:hydrogenase/urease accessory protein HupE